MHDPLSGIFIGQLESLSTVVGFPLDQLKLVVCLLLACPLAYVHSLLPRGGAIHHIYSAVIGAYMAWFMYGYQILHSLVTATLCYAILSTVSSKVSHKIVFVFMMGYLFASHAYRMYTDYMGWSMDYTGTQMLLTMKMTTLAFNFHDGTQEKDESLDSFQRSHRIAKLPNLLVFFGWVYCYLGFLVGPAFELNDYNALVDGTLFASKNRKAGQMPSGRFLAAAQVFGGALCCIAVNIAFSKFLSRAFLISDDYNVHLAFPLRVFYLWLFSVSFRMPYYFGWKMSEVSCIIAGIGYNGDNEKGNPGWNRCCNANVLQVETAMNIKTVTDSWNLATDHWLKHYIYARVQKTKFKAYDVYLTLLVSAIWHGLYLGYYMSFLTAAFIIHVARLARRVCRPRFMQADGVTPKSTKPIYDVITFLLHQVVFNYTMIPFVLLSHQLSWEFWKANYFFGHIALLIGLVAFTVAGGSAKSSSSSAVNRNASAAAKPHNPMNESTGSSKPPLVHKDTPHPDKILKRSGGDVAASEETSSPYNLRRRQQ